MNLQHLRIFHKVCQYRLMSIAAEDLGISPPAVTKALHKFEEECGVKLIASTGKTFGLTEAGDALHRIADILFKHEEIAEDCIQKFKGSSLDMVTLHCSESFGAYMLPQAMVHFSSRHPQVRLSCNIMHNTDAYENTLRLKNDLSVVSDPSAHPTLNIEPLLTEHLVLIAHNQHSFSRKGWIEPTELHNKDVILHEKGSFPSNAFYKMESEFGFKSNVRLELSNNEAIKQSVLGQLGVALISEHVVINELQRGELSHIHINSWDSSRTYCTVTHKDRFCSDNAKHFIDTLRMLARELMESHEFLKH